MLSFGLFLFLSMEKNLMMIENHGGILDVRPCASLTVIC